nr:MAG: peptidase A21 family protein [Chemarfal virus 216]
MQAASNININPNDNHTGSHVMSVNNIKMSVDTDSGAAFVEKYLHPPRPARGDYAGIPDKNNSPSVRAQYDAVKQIQTYDVSAGQQYNKVLLIHTSSAIAPVITIKYDLTGISVQSPDDVILNTNIVCQDMVAQCASGRMAYKSTTSNLNATGFNNQGVVTSALFRPNRSIYRIGDLISRYHGAIRDLDSFHRELCVIYDLVHRPWNGKDDHYKHVITNIGTAVDNFAQVLKVGIIPNESTPIVMMSPNAVSTAATEGSFVVQKFLNDTIPYLDFSDSGLSGLGVSVAAGMPCLIFEQVSATTGQLQFIKAKDQPGLPPGINTLQDLPWNDFCWGYTLYEGLSVAPGTSTTVTPPYLTVKTITGYEFQPLPNSVLSPFIKESAVYDFSALRLCTMANHSLPDSLPSKMNFWGSLGRMLLSVAPSLVKTLVDVFGSKTKSAAPSAPPKPLPKPSAPPMPTAPTRSLPRAMRQLTIARAPRYTAATPRPRRGPAKPKSNRKPKPKREVVMLDSQGNRIHRL